MAPQPRFVVRPTSDRTQVLRGLGAFAPESATPRFIDTLVEFSKRLQDDFKKTKKIDSLPVLVMVSTTSAQTTSYQATDLAAAIQFLEARKIRAYVTMFTPQGQTKNQGDQPVVAMPLANATRGRYEAINVSSRLQSRAAGIRHRDRRAAQAAPEPVPGDRRASECRTASGSAHRADTTQRDRAGVGRRAALTIVNRES